MKEQIQSIETKDLPAKLPTIIGLFLAVIFLNVIGVFLNLLPGKTRFFITIGSEWIIVFALLGIMVFGEGRKLNSIGFRNTTSKEIILGLAGFLIGVLTFMITTPLVNFFHLGSTTESIGNLLKVSIHWRIVFALTTGICEEILFRGYAIERLNSLTGRLSLSAGISLIGFVFMNFLFMGMGGGIQISVWSLIITGLYLWKRNLPACIIMHVLNNLFAFVIAPLLLVR